jgi:hypothetical protein
MATDRQSRDTADAFVGSGRTGPMQSCNLRPARSMTCSVPMGMRDGKPMTYNSATIRSASAKLVAADWDEFPGQRVASASLGRCCGIGLTN